MRRWTCIQIIPATCHFRVLISRLLLEEGTSSWSQAKIQRFNSQAKASKKNMAYLLSMKWVLPWIFTHQILIPTHMWFQTNLQFPTASEVNSTQFRQWISTHVQFCGKDSANAVWMDVLLCKKFSDLRLHPRSMVRVCLKHYNWELESCNESLRCTRWTVWR
jgi:hypothetical protein